jgi:hypothetical protein
MSYARNTQTLYVRLPSSLMTVLETYADDHAISKREAVEKLLIQAFDFRDGKESEIERRVTALELVLLNNVPSREGMEHVATLL